MNEFFSRIDDFLFDILGLVVPGFIFMSVLVFPIFFLIEENPTQLPQNAQMSILYLIDQIRDIVPHNMFAVLLVFICAYIIGHFVKVFSIILYDFLSTIFDSIINKFFLWMYSWIHKGANWIHRKIRKKDMYASRVYKYLRNISSPIRNTISKVFVFRPPSYFDENADLIDECVNEINRRLGANYEKRWSYAVFKFATIMSKQNQIKSLASNFLAKYNLYRSLTLVFLLSSIYFGHLHRAHSEQFLSQFSGSLQYIVTFTIFLTFTFHYKYKRYWTLCGNETLVSLYCLLNKDKINNA